MSLAVNNGLSSAATAPVVGTYAITPSAATGGNFVANDYDISYATAALTINTACADDHGCQSDQGLRGGDADLDCNVRRSGRRRHACDLR